ncbi:MAG: hypothetical protein GY749_26865 [Desulfobacteraceae bacterium]|nr:hypothetical protein [Desulfobacteraceae bacterium]
MLKKTSCLILILCLGGSVLYAGNKDRRTVSFDKNSTVSDALEKART